MWKKYWENNASLWEIVAHNIFEEISKYSNKKKIF